MELLTDHENYVELESNQDRTIMKNINCLIKKYQNELTKKNRITFKILRTKHQIFMAYPKFTNQPVLQQLSKN